MMVDNASCVARNEMVAMLERLEKDIAILESTGRLFAAAKLSEACDALATELGSKGNPSFSKSWGAIKQGL